MSKEKRFRPLLWGLVWVMLTNSCDKKDVVKNETIFKTLSSTESGIDFVNRLTENDSLNYFTYSYLYMGGGIAVGDINNDGLEDLFFTGNQVSNRLYLNRGNLKFEDITKKAGVGGDSRWYTGVTMADVNADGFLDIYCSVSGKFEPRTNQLYINNQDGTFSERAAEYGLGDIGHSVQSTFFDYDKDGDLDLYVANYPPTKFNSPTFVYQLRMKNLQNHESDHLYRNDDGVFIDVTEVSGVKNFGLSLSATVGDLNNDSWPDLYVSNDFNSPDFIYINNHDGTFREVVKEATGHTAFYGMGVDISDFNNDGNLDVFQVDMDAQNNRRQKANMASMNIGLFWSVVDAGFHYQYMQNCMQLNAGVYRNGVPHFSNISRMTGTSSTDWSWGPLFADFDNDGHKDLFVSNGTRREINNNDFFDQLESIEIKEDDYLELSSTIPSERIDNFIFKNNGNLKFERANELWGISYFGFSNGVVYADLDNDGDLELVTNNIDDTAKVFENKSSNKNNAIKIKFRGTKKNSFGLGARVYITTDGQTQMQELTLTRGFQSSVSPTLHFGLSDHRTIDELKVVWPDGKTQLVNKLKANQTVVLRYEEASGHTNTEPLFISRLFHVETDSVFPEHTHVENAFDDYGKQVLLPHKMSALGPGIATGDLNGDGLQDYFIGGSQNHPGAIFLQTQAGFKKTDFGFIEDDKAYEDIGAVIFDADGDGNNDLYVVSGGYEFSENSEYLQDRLYLNNGNGFDRADKGVLPQMPTSGSKVYAEDFDKDGKKDLLVLGRQVPGKYPLPANTYLLKNVGTKKGAKFQPFSEDQQKAFRGLGMATAAVITDFNGDKWSDIIIVGEWMPIKVFQNNNGVFEEVSIPMGLDEKSNGWWWSIEQGDFDNDGDMDYLVGNNGLNYKYKATEEETFDIYVSDFDKNQQIDIVLGYYSEGKQYPVRGRECSSQQIPGIKSKFENYESFSEATLVDVYSKEELETSLHYKAQSFASILLKNNGTTFSMIPLPIEAQISSINKILVDDFDQDGNLDAVIAGNLYASEVETPRNDAGHGYFLKGNGKGNFMAIPPSESGFFAIGDVKDMAVLESNAKKYIVVAKNADMIQTIGIDPSKNRLKSGKKPF